MSKIKGAIVVNTDRCKGCQLCIVACPKNVIALAQKKVNVHGYPYVEAVNPDDCIGCASCGVVCPDGCITVYKKKMEELQSCSESLNNDIKQLTEQIKAKLKDLNSIEI